MKHKFSVDSLHYQDTPDDDKSAEDRPVPAPRRSMSQTPSRDQSVTPSHDEARYNEGPPTYTDLPHHSVPQSDERSTYARK